MASCENLDSCKLRDSLEFICVYWFNVLHTLINLCGFSQICWQESWREWIVGFSLNFWPCHWLLCHTIMLIDASFQFFLFSAWGRLMLVYVAVIGLLSRKWTNYNRGISLLSWRVQAIDIIHRFRKTLPSFFSLCETATILFLSQLWFCK